MTPLSDAARLAELRRLADLVGDRRGWDFSRMRVARDPVPWDYAEVVRRYLRPSSRVLDIGTGGGERFLQLAPSFGHGLGTDVDPAMIDAARANTPPGLRGTVDFAVMPAAALAVPDASMDIVLTRHAPIAVAEVVRVLRLGGYFIAQGVGRRNTQNICAVFGCDPGGGDDHDGFDDRAHRVEQFRRAGCAIVGEGEYDVRYWFLDLESLLFWLKAIPIPNDFAIERHWRQVEQIVATARTERGIQTNEHRELLIVQKL
jgi:SAM-dependent methyltransferase